MKLAVFILAFVAFAIGPEEHKRPAHGYHEDNAYVYVSPYQLDNQADKYGLHAVMIKYREYC